MIRARLNVVTLGVRDLPAVRSFYERLGWTSHSDGDEFARFETGGATLTLFSADKAGGRGPRRTAETGWVPRVHDGGRGLDRRGG